MVDLSSRPISILTLVAFLCAPSTFSQAIDPDVIDVTAVDGWEDTKKCLRIIFDLPGHRCANCANIINHSECETNACMCRPSTLGELVPWVGEEALERCRNLDDQSTAVSMLTAYCSLQGYTEIVEPTILPEGGGPEAAAKTTAIAMPSETGEAEPKPTSSDTRPTKSEEKESTTTSTQNTRTVQNGGTLTESLPPAEGTAGEGGETDGDNDAQGGRSEGRGMDVGAIVGIVFGILSAILTGLGVWYAKRAVDQWRHREGGGEGH